MRRFFNTSFPDISGHICLLFVRLAVGSFILTHGLPKLTRLTSGAEIKFADPFGFGATFSLALAVFAEVFCALFIMLGLGTRLASIPLVITMLVAAFHAHADDPFGTKEKPLLFLLIFVVLLVFGSGRYSVDNMISKK
jgi:putative oxidoreductase